jgi:hypothetical protein
MGGGVAALFTNAHHDPQRIFAFSAAGSLIGIIATEHYLQPSADSGQPPVRTAFDPIKPDPKLRLSFDPMSMFLVATRTPGNHSLLNVRF